MELHSLPGRIAARIKRSLSTPPDPQGRDAFLQSLPKGGVCAEIGVWKGEFSRRISRVKKPYILHLVDSWRFVNDPRRWNGGAIAKNQDDMDAIAEAVISRYLNSETVFVHRTTSAEFFSNVTCSFDGPGLGPASAGLRLLQGGFLVLVATEGPTSGYSARTEEQRRPRV